MEYTVAFDISKNFWHDASFPLTGIFLLVILVAVRLFLKKSDVATYYAFNPKFAYGFAFLRLGIGFLAFWSCITTIFLLVGT